MAKRVESALSYFYHHYKEISDNTYSWYNVNKILTTEELQKLVTFFKNHNELKLLIVINGVSGLRPQRTWGSLPEWFRSNTEFRGVYHYENAFIFISSIKLEDEEDFNVKKCLIRNARCLAMDVNAECEVWEK